MSKTQQADLIWNALFIQHSPISEACRGVLTTLNALGLDVKKRDLAGIRQWFAKQDPEAYLDRCMEVANVKTICMTNSPFRRFGTADLGKGLQRRFAFRSGPAHRSISAQLAAKQRSR